MPTRQRVLAGLVILTGSLSIALLWGVLATVFFGITVVYVLSPLRQFLVARGASRRVAALASTTVALLAAALLVVPLLWSLYERRSALIAFLRGLPATVEFEVYGFALAVDVDVYISALRGVLGDLAVAVAQQGAVLGLKAFLLVLLVYGLLLRPNAAPAVVFRTVPRQYHDVVRSLHERARDTLYAIYVLQGATALSTFLVAYVVFAGLGYDVALGLAVVAGILQFIPVVGPSIVIAIVAATEVASGNVRAAALVLGVGVFFVGFLPDVVVRTQLATYAAGIPATLYFVGFTGGVLSVGLVGFIAGPLVVALFVESVDLLTTERGPFQEKLGGAASAGGASDGEPSVSGRSDEEGREGGGTGGESASR